MEAGRHLAEVSPYHPLALDPGAHTLVAMLGMLPLPTELPCPVDIALLSNTRTTEILVTVIN